MGAEMKPYYEQDGITIYHGDCREVLATMEPVDIVVSSPPYNTIATTKPSGMLKEHNHKQNAGYNKYSDDMNEADYQKWMIDIFGACADVAAGLVWINHKTRFRGGFGIHPLRLFPWEFHSEIVWNRNGSLTLNAKRYAPSHEFIYGFGVPHYWDRRNDKRMTVWNIQPEREIKGHPCPFPVAIPSRCIESSCPAGGVVLDPFMGSGTTLRAAKDLGRKAIGIEIDERYCEIAANRLAQGVLFGVDNA
jgi:DNA modification methylase